MMKFSSWMGYKDGAKGWNDLYKGDMSPEEKKRHDMLVAKRVKAKKTKDDPIQKEWSNKDQIWVHVHNIGPKLKPEIKRLVGRLVGDEFKDPSDKTYGSVTEPQLKIAIAQILLDLAREYEESGRAADL